MGCIHILRDWKAVYHAKREHQRLKGEMAQATAISGRMLECASILEIKCELEDESGQKVSSSLNCGKGEGLGVSGLLWCVFG